MPAPVCEKPTTPLQTDIQIVRRLLAEIGDKAKQNEELIKAGRECPPVCLEDVPHGRVGSTVQRLVHAGLVDGVNIPTGSHTWCYCRLTRAGAALLAAMSDPGAWALIDECFGGTTLAVPVESLKRMGADELERRRSER